MPTYEYSCATCEEHLEVVQSFKDDALTTCPNCGGNLRKVFGSIGVVFKGSGFYKTDSRSTTKSGASSSSSSDKKEAASSTGSSSSSESSSAGSSSSSGSSGSSSSSTPSSGSSGAAAAS
ncbi:MAG TPA: FmdB family zinc ribbon protein [Acidimicrobiales bacterium]|nr:FmdB family zinc ribbon protein [Acidimicrobiales bacterium]